MSGDQIEPARLARLQAEHERLKKNPRIRILGEGPGKVNVARAFAHALSELTPTQRRLAMAMACAQPWRNDPAAMPACYRRDLGHALFEAREEQGSVASTPFDPGRLFEAEPEPISPYLLRQLAELTPGDRRSSLASMVRSCWKREYPAELRALAARSGIDLREPEVCPEWALRDEQYHRADLVDERKVYRPPPPDAELRTPEEVARALEAELNRRIED